MLFNLNTIVYYVVKTKDHFTTCNNRVINFYFSKSQMYTFVCMYIHIYIRFVWQTIELYLMKFNQKRTIVTISSTCFGFQVWIHFPLYLIRSKFLRGMFGGEKNIANEPLPPINSS